MSDGAVTSTRLACPDCGGTRFSWILSQVQFGSVYAAEDGHFFEEGMKMGAVTGSDVDDKSVFCTTCEESRRRVELVPVGPDGVPEQEAA